MEPAPAPNAVQNALLAFLQPRGGLAAFTNGTAYLPPANAQLRFARILVDPASATLSKSN
jgi:hypothetical protein